MEAGGAFQLDVRLRLTDGIKEQRRGAQNRTEKSIPKREREEEENDTDMRGELLEQPKKTVNPDP